MLWRGVEIDEALSGSATLQKPLARGCQHAACRGTRHELVTQVEGENAQLRSGHFDADEHASADSLHADDREQPFAATDRKHHWRGGLSVHGCHGRHEGPLERLRLGGICEGLTLSRALWLARICEKSVAQLAGGCHNGLESRATRGMPGPGGGQSIGFSAGI